MTTTEFRNDRDGLIDVREERQCAGRLLEFREDKQSGSIILEGYAATFDEYDVHGGPSGGGWVEQLAPPAFDETLAEQPDVQLLVNHAGTPLARTTSGTLKLSRDSHGLRVWAKLDASDPDVQALAPKLRPQPGTNRANMDEMSFAFRVTDQTWDTSYSHRTINSLSLEKGDVSVVNYGMNPGTRAVLSDAVGALAQLSSRELVELRKLDHNQVKRATAALMAISAPQVPPGLGYIGPGPSAEDTHADHVHVAVADDGVVKYADPGYKADGKKRYPLSTREQIKPAWSYINMPKNQKGYSAGQLSAIKGRIAAAAEKFGIDIAEEKKSAPTSVSHIDLVPLADGNTSLVAVMTDGSRVPLPTQQRSQSPNDMPQPDASAQTGGSFQDQWYGEWSPDSSPIDPHDEPYDVGLVGKMPSSGPTPDNVDTGGNAPHNPGFHGVTEADPHDVSIDKEMLSMDTNDTTQAPDTNVITSLADSTKAISDLVGTSITGLADSLAGAIVGTKRDSDGDCDDEMKAMDEECAMDDDDDEEKDEKKAMADEECDRAYDPETGEGGDTGEAREAVETPVAVIELDLCMAEALDKTIVHAYKLAPENEEVRKLLIVARRQLNSMRNLSPAANANTEISRKLAELRKEVGEPDAGTVSDGLTYLRSVGSAPVGYRGLLDHDPDLHITTPSERLAKEALEKLERARVAATDYDKASDRLKRAQREAELNAAIRRNQKAGR